MERQMKHLIMICLLVLGVTSGAEAANQKVFVFNMSGHPDRLLDPARCFNPRCQRVMWGIYENLGELSENSREIVPGLAESWKASPDGLTYTIHLRKGVSFHDASPFNAEAVKINLDRYTSNLPHHTGFSRFTLTHLVNQVTVQDEHTLTVTLKHKNADPLFRVPMVSPARLAKDGPEYGKHPVGTGPFRFVRWDDNEVRLAANPDYWGGRPKLDQISFRVFGDGKTKMQKFMAGRVDYMSLIRFKWLERVRENPNTRFMPYPALNLCYIGLYADRKPFEDPQVRKAIAKGIDIERANHLIGRGRAVSARNLIQPGADGYDPDLKRPAYSPDEAKRLLHEAGYPSGLQFSLVYMRRSKRMSSLAQAIKADLSRIGVTVELLGFKSWPKLVAKIQEPAGNAFLKCSHFITPRPEDSMLRLFLRDNYFRYNNPKVRKLLDQALRVKDPSAQLVLYAEAHRIVLEDAPIIPMYHMVRLAGYNARVTGLKLNAMGLPVDRFLGVDIREE